MFGCAFAGYIHRVDAGLSFGDYYFLEALLRQRLIPPAVPALEIAAASASGDDGNPAEPDPQEAECRADALLFLLVRPEGLFGEIPAPYLGLDELIRAKESTGRAQDRADVRVLRRARKERKPSS